MYHLLAMFLLEMLQLPFMQRAFLAGAVLAVLLGWLGVYVVTRRMSFVGDGVAHASLAAVAFAVVVGWAPLPTALVFSLFLGAILFFLEKKTTLSSDAAIGLVFTFGMALGVILLQYHEGYVPELMSFLFGSILAVSSKNVLTISLLGLAMIAVLYFKRKEFTFLAIDDDGAKLAGVSPMKTDLLFYVMVSAAVVLAIKLIGVILVSALLIIPSSTAKIFATSFAQFEWLAVAASLLTVWLGLTFSYVLDWPSGASIVVTGVMLLLLSIGFKWMTQD